LQPGQHNHAPPPYLLKHLSAPPPSATLFAAAATRLLQAAMLQSDFAAAAEIFTKGKNNRRNETHMRNMQDGVTRDRTNETWFDMYNAFFKSVTYLKDLIE
jgi:hypothetical protein